jgi:prepilin-type processing-associated H-X9-DG protein
LAVHNFHDTYNGLPPYQVGSQRASFWWFIMPFAEQQNAALLLNGRNVSANTTIGDSMVDNWNRLNITEQDSIASIPWMKCPSRRSGVQKSRGAPDQRNGPGGVGAPGPNGDYSVVFLYKDYTDTSTSDDDWWNHHNPCDQNHVNHYRSAIRVAYVNCAIASGGVNGRENTWKPRDSFARLTDGTSNTYIVGEKHVRADSLNLCCDGSWQDGSYLFDDGNWDEYNIGRSARHAIGRGPTQGNMRADNTIGFGSWHSGTFNMLKGDGSVAGVTFTQNYMTRVYLAHVSDGVVPTDN